MYIYRATRHVDLLAFGAGDPDEASMREIVKTVCAVPCPEDGLVFDLESPSILPVRAEEEYQGQRAVLRAWLGKSEVWGPFRGSARDHPGGRALPRRRNSVGVIFTRDLKVRAR